VQVGGEKGAFPPSISMDGKTESELSSSLTSNRLVGASRAITHAAAGLPLARG